MKKAIKLMAMVLFVVSMTALTSCTKDNDKLILGKWKLQSVTYQSAGQTVELTIAQMAALNGEEITDFFVEFKSDGYVYASASIYFDEQGTRYSIEGDTLFIHEEGEDMEIDIVELSNKKMSLGKADVDDDDVYLILNFVRS